MANNNGNTPVLTPAEQIALDALIEKFTGVTELAEAARKIYGPQQVTDEPAAEIRPQAVPALPEWAKMPPNLAKQVGAWLDLYTDYGRSVSPMTPRTFHESAGLWLASVAIARRLVLRMPYDDIYPNLFIVWLAETTLYRKSTALNIGRKLAREVLAHLMAPQDTTPEALLSDMAGYQPQNLGALPLAEQQEWEKSRDFSAQRGLVYDEMSGLMAGAGKDYNAGLLEAFLRFYDCDSHYDRSSRGQGRVVVKNSYLSILGASTPAAMSFHFKSERLWGLGWWPRFAILTPEGRPEWEEPRAEPRPSEIAQKLQVLYNRLPTAKYPDFPQPLEVKLGAGVYDAWSKYNRALSHELLTDELNPNLKGTYGRLPTHALKIAMILAALDWSASDPAPKIELPHLARAIEIAETWRASAHRALDLTTANMSSRVKDRITRLLAKYPNMTERDLVKSLKDIDQNELHLALVEMVEIGDVVEVDAGPGAKGGRPTKRYTVSKE
jgi:hypothetical protein